MQSEPSFNTLRNDVRFGKRRSITVIKENENSSAERESFEQIKRSQTTL